MPAQIAVEDLIAACDGALGFHSTRALLWTYEWLISSGLADSPAAHKLESYLRNPDNHGRRVSEFGLTMLSIASFEGFEESAAFLIGCGSSVSSVQPHTGASDLLAACDAGHLGIARRLIEAGADVNQARIDNGSTPLNAATISGHEDLVSLLLENGAEVDRARTDTGATPLMAACVLGHIEIARLLVEHGANVNYATPKTGETALISSSYDGPVRSVKYLIEQGADMDQVRNVDGLSALMVACDEGRREVVKLLIENDAALDLQEYTQGNTALTFAVSESHLEIVELLVKAGAPINQSKSNGASPLWLAANQLPENQALVRLLLTCPSIEVNQQGHNNFSPIHMAAGHGHVAVLRLLLNHPDADVNQSTKGTGYTPLMLASMLGQLDALDILLCSPAIRLDLCSFENKTAIDYAVEHGQSEVVEILDRASRMVDPIVVDQN